MPTIKIKQPDGSWKYTNEPSSNADTLDGKHADEFAAASDVEALQTKVGDTSVSEQINTALDNYNSDWNASEGEEGYIKNRTHYHDIIKTPVLEETIVSFNPDNSYLPYIDIQLEVGKTYEVTMNGTVYVCQCYLESSGWETLGNEEALNTFVFDGDGEPFSIRMDVENSAFVLTSYMADNDGVSTYNIPFSIIEKSEELKKLDPKFLPEGIATEEYVNIRVPSWTVEDEDKFLRIVNGTSTWVSLPNAEGVSF